MPSSYNIIMATPVIGFVIEAILKIESRWIGSAVRMSFFPCTVTSTIFP